MHASFRETPTQIFRCSRSETPNAKKLALFSANGCYLARPMSRFSSFYCALFATAAVNYLTAQVALPPVQAPGKPVAPAPAAVSVPAQAPAAVANPNALKWDAESRDYTAKTGEVSASFTFNVTNVSPTEVSITSLRTSCGCTVAQLPPLPEKPFVLLPGSNVAINVTMDLRGKMGVVTKTISVDSSAGFKSLLVKVNLPQTAPANTAAAGPNVAPGNGMGDRAKNIQSALADAQAIFKGECAKCHVDKGVAKMGKELYAADCGICHDAEHRAAMVPDLKVPRSQRDLAFWQKWITEGKAGTMMPAFASTHGGPLTQEQIDSLTVYLYENYPKSPVAVASPGTPPGNVVIRQLPPPVPAAQKN
jgi:mono/diheme cytochrome c family protein